MVMTRIEQATPFVWKGTFAGLAAGLVASAVMDLFQAGIAKLFPSDDQGIPATKKAADRIAEIGVGHPFPEATRPLASQAVHYALGAALGSVYGMVAEIEPRVTAGRGTAFGLAVAALLDEAGVPVADLGDPPWKTPASTHAYTIASHLVFGAVAEGTLRLLRPILGASKDERET